MPKRSKKLEGSSAGCVVWIIIIAVVAGIYAFDKQSKTASPPPSPVIQAPSPTRSPLFDNIAKVEGVQSVPVAYTAPLDEGGTVAAIEVFTTAGYNNPETATNIYAYTIEHIFNTYDVPAPISFSVIINDGLSATDYRWDNDTSTWNTTQVTLPDEPTRTPQPTITAPPSTAAPRTPIPQNCETAVAAGLSAQQAAQFKNLDRDNDGVACYGD